MQDRIAYQGITFDDVLLEPAYSDVVPRDVDVRTQLTQTIRLNIPILSSPMDTVTTADLAIALAQEGGLGIIHKNLSVPDQTREVDKVKRSENGIITDPVTLSPDETVETARKLMQQHNISGVPITINDIDKLTNFPNACKDRRGRLRVGAAVGVHDYERAESLIRAGVDVLVVDSAHGHSGNVIDTVAELKRRFEIDVIAGNVATADGARALVEAGADAVKVGIGPGSICTTRVISGVGVPQITAIAQATQGVADSDVPIIADGGFRFSGDITNALAG